MKTSKKNTVSFLLLFVLLPTVFAQNLLDEIIKHPPDILMQQMRSEKHPDARVVGSGLFSFGQKYVEIYSPATQQFAGTADGNLYVRAEYSNELKTFNKPQEGWYWHIENAKWSPDGKYIAVKQINDQEVPNSWKHRRDHHKEVLPSWGEYS